MYFLEITQGSAPGSRECYVYMKSMTPGDSHHKQCYGWVTRPIKLSSSMKIYVSLILGLVTLPESLCPTLHLTPSYPITLLPYHPLTPSWMTGNC